MRSVGGAEPRGGASRFAKPASGGRISAAGPRPTDTHVHPRAWRPPTFNAMETVRRFDVRPLVRATVKLSGRLMSAIRYSAAVQRADHLREFANHGRETPSKERTQAITRNWNEVEQIWLDCSNVTLEKQVSRFVDLMMLSHRSK